MSACDCVNPKEYGHSSHCPFDQIESLQGYRDAFYKIAEMLGLSAMPISPKDAFETVMVPRLRALLDRPADAGSEEAS
jgi:hypothetical protein